MNLKPNFILLSLVTLSTFFYSENIIAQTQQEKWKVGFNYGQGSQDKFPFNDSDYSHDVTFYKLRANYRFKEKTKWIFEFNFEANYNVVEHQLLNRFFIQPDVFDDVQGAADLFTQKRTIKEYVLDMGVVARYKIYNGISAYAIGSVGPMIANKDTERLAKGFAFSDVFGLGISYEFNKFQIDFRYSLRHTSNLEFQQPNSGHNTVNTEFSILYQL